MLSFQPPRALQLPYKILCLDNRRCACLLRQTSFFLAFKSLSEATDDNVARLFCLMLMEFLTCSSSAYKGYLCREILFFSVPIYLIVLKLLILHHPQPHNNCNEKLFLGIDAAPLRKVDTRLISFSSTRRDVIFLGFQVNQLRLYAVSKVDYSR